MISVWGEIQGNAYRAFAEFAIAHSDAVMLVFRSYGRPFKQRIKDARKHLKPFRIASRNNHKSKSDTFEWPGTITWEKTLTHVDIYRLSPEVRAYILSADDIFAWIYPDRPEDIAFFSGGECWLFTTAHEKFCNICKHESEAAELLDALGVTYDRDSEPCELYTEKYALPIEDTRA